MNRYPVYVISKGRAESRATSNALERMEVPYRIVIEPQEYEQYAACVDPAKILTLPEPNYGDGCSIPARNFVWEHSLSVGARRHWIFDDNIPSFYRLNECRKRRIKTPEEFFSAMENFVDRYTNVALAGPHCVGFAPALTTKKSVHWNTRIYSCILIKNDIVDGTGQPYRWRGRMNEDTDLSLRVLKDGWCTCLFHSFLMDKTTTGRNVGGNRDELYAGDGRWKMAESLRQQHPDITEVVWKFNRWQHSVDYSGFKNNTLIRDPNVPEGPYRPLTTLSEPIGMAV